MKRPFLRDSYFIPKLIFGLVLLTIFTFFVFQKLPKQSEIIYGHLFYPYYQKLRYFVFGIWPYPYYYLPFLFVLLALIWILSQYLTKKSRLQLFLVRFVSIPCLLYVLFYVFWGFNYTRPSLQKRMGLSLEQKPSKPYIFSDLEETITQLNQLRKEISTSDTLSWYGPIDDRDFLNAVAYQLAEEVGDFLQEWGYKNTFKPVVKKLPPKGVLMRLSTSGIMFPFTGEAYVDKGLPNISLPNVVAHEASHIYGVTDEGECNFVALQVCKKSASPLVKYSAQISYLRYASQAAYQEDEKQANKLLQQLDPEVVNDIKSRKKAHAQFPDLIPKTRDMFYDQYLKVQGVQTGIKSYGQVYLLQHAYKQKAQAKHNLGH